MIEIIALFRMILTSFERRKRSKELTLRQKIDKCVGITCELNSQHEPLSTSLQLLKRYIPPD